MEERRLRWGIVISLYVLIVILGLVLWIYFEKQKRSELSQCPGTIIPGQFSCVGSWKLKRIRPTCNTETQGEKANRWKRFLTSLLKRYRPDISWITKKPQSHEITAGIFYFADRDLLEVFPTDFGQNQVTPYGLGCFFPSYLSCISDPDKLCSVSSSTSSTSSSNSTSSSSTSSSSTSSSSTSSSSTTTTCSDILSTISSFAKKCPFALREYVSADPAFFNLTGLLGVFNVQPYQAIVIKGILPVEDMQLKYWSINCYLADRTDPLNVCSPYRDVYFASICPPCSCFSSGMSSKKNVRFGIVISLNPDMEKYVRINTDFSDTDFVWTFRVPNAANSFPAFEDGLPNPNGISTQDAVYNPYTDRLAILFRMNTEEDEWIKTPPVYRTWLENPTVEIALISAPTLIPTEPPFGWTPFPSFLNPVSSESLAYSQQCMMLSELRSLAQELHYSTESISIYKSLTCIIAPYNEGVRDGKFPYRDGTQAIVMAGNANGDNHDAWYKPSATFCLGKNDVAICVAVNHNYFRNSLFCSMNLINVQKQMGYAGCSVYTRESPIYISLYSRNKERLSLVSKRISSENDKKLVWIETGNTIDWKVPKCHGFLLMERSYINPIMDGKDIVLEEDRVKNWDRVTGPNGMELIDPQIVVFRSLDLSFWVVFFLLLVAFILVVCVPSVHIFFEKKETRSSFVDKNEGSWTKKKDCTKVKKNQ